MEIEINKDLDTYKETVVLGLTARQLIFSVISVVIGGSIVLLTYKFIGLTGSAYVAVPVVAPMALNGFYHYQGMTFTEMMKRKLKCIFFNRRLTYISEEGEPEIKRLLREEQQKAEADKKKKRGKKK
ncbi:MAG: PrgI family protein [Lachnospiraceae bacterium]|nr:PrgI family protein [Lachnospiraceae bacterium]